jgi:diguanylate cyclase (GGDEF)-like protein
MSPSHSPDITQRRQVLRLLPPPTEGAMLMVVHGERFSQRIALDQRPLAIGRGEECGFRIDDPAASRRHCVVWLEEGRFWVRDLGATNQTCVNDRGITLAELVAGDYLTVGDTVFRLIRNGTLEARYHSGLHRLNTLDPLTQVYNRRHFRDLLDAACAQARAAHTPLSLIFLDLDHFKRINDNHGHCAGDAVLHDVGRLLKAELQLPELAGRLGGEEFAVLLPHTRLPTARNRAQTLRRIIAANATDSGGEVLSVTASLGLVEWSEQMASVVELMREADRQLYRAKALGRNRVCTPL